MTDWLRDLRLGVRALRRTPQLSVVGILALGLAIGAFTTAFSVANRLLIHPLPFPRADRLTALWQVDPARPANWQRASASNFLDWQRLSRSFDAMAGAQNASFTLTSFEDGDTPLIRRVTHGYFELLGAAPLVGRTFRPDEDRRGGPAAIVLSYELWQRRFGGDPGAVGASTELDRRPFTIVGVMPRDFENPVFGPSVRPQAWVAAQLAETGLDRGAVANGFLVMAHLRDGMALERARAEMAEIGRRLQREYPEANRNVGVLVTGAAEPIVRRTRPAMLLLLGSVLFVLLVACANVANLLLTRAVERRRELAIRRALGASAGVLGRQLLAESLVLAAAGGAVGLLAALWGTQAVLGLLPESPLVARLDFTPDATVLGFTLSLTVATGVALGLLPALQVLRSTPGLSLVPGTLRATGDRERQRTRGALVVAEVALSLVLLIGAGLMMRSFGRLQALDPGFDPDGLVTFRVSTRGERYEDPEARIAFFRDVRDSIAAAPGVAAVGVSQAQPFFAAFGETPVSLDPAPAAEGSEQRMLVRQALPGYFAAMGMTLQEGRDLEPTDTRGAPLVAVISRTASRRLMADRGAVGETLTILDDRRASRRVRIVGVVSDVRSAESPPEPLPVVYLPLAQDPSPTSMAFVVRAPGDLSSLLRTVEERVRAVDPLMPVYLAQTMRSLLETLDVRTRFLSSLLAVFAGLALVLAVTGTYAVLSYAVSRRTRELGIRIALGAGRRDVLAMVLRGAAHLAALGITAGLAGAVGLSRALESQLYGVTSTDPAIYAALSALLGCVVLLAAALPAVRASHVDPIRVLRED
jgi:putative ABC transport system permease protein